MLSATKIERKESPFRQYDLWRSYSQTSLPLESQNLTYAPLRGHLSNRVLADEYLVQCSGVMNIDGSPSIVTGPS